MENSDFAQTANLSIEEREWFAFHFPTARQFKQTWILPPFHRTRLIFWVLANTLCQALPWRYCLHMEIRYCLIWDHSIWGNDRPSNASGNVEQSHEEYFISTCQFGRRLYIFNRVIRRHWASHIHLYRISNAELRLNSSNVALLLDKGQLQGHIVSEEWISVDFHKLRAFADDISPQSKDKTLELTRTGVMLQTIHQLSCQNWCSITSCHYTTSRIQLE